MAHSPTSSATRPARRTVAQKAPRARAALDQDSGTDLELDAIDEQFETTAALRVAGVFDTAREDSRQYFD